MSRVLIIGPGDMGQRIARGLGASGRVREVVLAGLAHGEGPAIAGIVASTTDVVARFEPADCSDPEVVGDVLARTGPDVVVQCASLLSPWALGRRSDPVARALAAAGLGIALPLQLPVVLATMRAARALRYRGPIVNLSFPDVVNTLLDRLDLAPTCGLGNVTMQQLRVRAALRHELGAGAELPLLRLIGHHSQVYGVMRAEQPADSTDRVRVFLGEGGERADHLAYGGHPFAAGVIYNEVTAAAVVQTVLALLPGAAPTRLSVPAPHGLPGGYPVRIAGGRVELDLPPGVDLDEAVRWCERQGRVDGVDGIRADGTVVYTEAAAAAVRDVAPWAAEPLAVEAVPERAARLLALLAG